MPLGGICERGNVLLLWEPPLPAERSPGTDRELERSVFCSQECAGAGLLAIRTERDGH